MKESATFITAAAITIFLTGWVIIVHDASPDFKQFLVLLTGHHWISVSLISIVLLLLSRGSLLSSNYARKPLRMNDAKLGSSALIVVTLIMMLGVLTWLIANFLAD
jgi:hypothetical protein